MRPERPQRSVLWGGGFKANRRERAPRAGAFGPDPRPALDTGRSILDPCGVEAAQHVIDVGEQDFQQAVLERSRELPVLVDFWASWCAPCQVLTPLLEKVVGEFGGRVLLAKVDADASPRLAQTLQIQSLPTVMLIVDGRSVDGFVGAQDEAGIRELLRRHVQTTVDELLDQAEAQLRDGDIAGARAILAQALKRDAPPSRAHLIGARLALAAGDEIALRAQVDLLDVGTPERRQADQLIDALAFGSACGPGEAAHREALEACATDLGGAVWPGVLSRRPGTSRRSVGRPARGGQAG